jgi:hypothetical protein
MAMGQTATKPVACTKSLLYRGTTLGSREIRWIQQVIDKNPSKSQIAIAERVCREFGWLRPNGEPADISCSVFLRAMATRGIIRLPLRRARRKTRQESNDAATILEALGTVPGVVEHQPTGQLIVRPIEREERDGFRLHMQRYHYLDFVKPAGESICYAALMGNDLVALLVWGAATLYNGPRDLFIGWNSETRQRNLPWVVNNSRFLILPWIRQPCLASRILGANLRRLNQDWEAKYCHRVLLAETFVDQSKFRGTCYRASNWIEVGETQGWSRLRRGFIKHGVKKLVLLKPLHRRAAQYLRERDLPADLTAKRQRMTNGLRHGG